MPSALQSNLGRFACLMMLFTTVAAGPSTNPADRNTTEYSAVPAKAHFRVPKLWKRLPINGSSPDIVFVFDPAPTKTPKSLMSQQLVEMYLDKPKEHQKSLDDVVSDTRKAFLHMNPKLKFTKDAATTYNGQPAWTFHWTEQNKVTVTHRDGSVSSDDDFISTDRIETLWLQNDTICQIGLHADVRLMPSLILKAEPVAKSLTWDQ